MVSITQGDQGQTSKSLISIEHWLESLSAKYAAPGVELIRKACDLAGSAHAGQVRVSGEPYIQHALAVANILVELGMDYETVCAAILHDVVEDTTVTLDDIKRDFGETIMNLVDGVTKMMVIQSFKGLEESARKEKKERAQAESLRKMLLAMVQDIRVVLIKIADRTHNMRTLGALEPEKQKRIARETLDIYAPLANRLGIWQLKWELEDLSFRYLDPATYKRIAKMVDEKRGSRETFIKNFIGTLQRELLRAGVKAEVTGRPKHIYSIHRKMKSKNVDYHEIHDTRGVRILVNTIPECYTALGIVHSLWHHISGEFDDYIATPKENNYQSIHTAISGPEGKVVEVQIRTFQMHHDNELGVAAHWRYKEGVSSDAGFDRKIAWLRQILEWKDDVADAGDFVNQFKSDAFQDQIYVFTPKGSVVDLPAKATALDFAYHVHTEIGHRCRGAKVNGHMVPLTYQLSNGEQVEILTVKRGEPSRDWLNTDLGYLRTTRARHKVQHWFKSQHHDSNVAAGRSMLEKELHRLGLTDINFEKLAKRLNFAKTDEFQAAIGRGDIKLSQVVKSIQEQLETEREPVALLPHKPSKESGGDVRIQGVGNLLTQLANCCKPLPGDEIAGYITRGRGVTIHRKDCSNILRYISQSPERLIEVEWGGKESKQVYPVDIQIRAFDRHGLLRDVASVLSNERVNIIAVNTLSDKDQHVANMTLTLEINDLDTLSKILSKINKLQNVIEVRRKRR